MPGGIEILPSSSAQNIPLNLNTHHRVNGAAKAAAAVDDEDEGGVGSIVPDRTGKHSFCRLCLTHADALNPLFPPDAAPDRTLLAQILDCVEVQITLPDDIKSLICNDCVQQIYTFSNFKELCKSNDLLLKSSAFTREESDDNEGSADVNRSEVTSPTGTNVISEDASSTPDVSLFEKLYEQGVEVEAIGQPSGMLRCQDFASMNSEDREAERKAKNAARMRRWRMRQREKHEKPPLVQDPESEQPEPVVEHKEVFDFKQQEEALRMQQIQEMFAILAQQQLRQVEAEIRRLKSGVQSAPIPQIPLESMIKSEPQQDERQSSRQASPTSEQQMASLRRSRAEYMRKWRAKRYQSQQQKQQHNQQTASALLTMVGRPPTILPAPGESEKLAIQRHNRAEYMRRWRRERLKQELSPEEFEDWCSKSEQRRRFREWQTVRESASSAGDETMDYVELEPGIRS